MSAHFRPFCATLLAGLVVTAGLALPAGAADLVIHVDGLRSDRGTIRASLYGNQAQFRSREKLMTIEVPADQRGVVVAFTHLPPGRYGATFYHDENRNGRHDKFMGLPREGYGFTNNAPARFGPPAFADMAVEVGVTETLGRTRLKY